MLMLLVSWKSSSQIVTSKKEAQKKGIYNYSEKEVITSDRTVAALDKPGRKIPKGPAKIEEPKRKKSVLLETEKEDPNFVPEDIESYYAQQIVNNAKEFDGVRYRGGGTTKDGMDCSGMVYATFKIFDVTLPRSSHEMAKVGEVLDFKDIKKGDLIFFKNNPKKRSINHVGIVTEVTEEGEVKFIHSSSSNGVVVSSMNEPYYDRTYVQANRVITE